MSCGNGVCPFSDFRAQGGPLSDPDIACLVDGAVQTAEFEPGQTLFLQGQSSTSLYSLTAGMVKICSHSADGREQIVGLSSPGKMLLGLQSLNENRYAYTAIASTLVRACKINHRALLDNVRDIPEVAMRLIAAVNAQLAYSRALMEVMGHSSAAAKIAVIHHPNIDSFGHSLFAVVTVPAYERILSFPELFAPAGVDAHFIGFQAS